MGKIIISFLSQNPVLGTNQRERGSHAPPKAEFPHYFEHVGYLIADINVTSNKVLIGSVQNDQYHHTLKYANFVES